MRANDAWEALMTAHAVLIKRFAGEDIWAEASMREYDVLYTLSKGPVRLRELNRHVLLSQPALSRLVDRLAARGLLCRAADSADGRGVLLSLTSEGMALQRRIGRRHARSVAGAMTGPLSQAELGQLTAICQKLVDGVDGADRRRDRIDVVDGPSTTQERGQRFIDDRQEARK